MKLLAMTCVLAFACHQGNGGSANIDAAEVLCGEATCTGTQFCDFALNTCGEMSGGTFETPDCRPRTQSCPAYSGPACGCDGQIYASACDAQAAAVDVDARGSCALPAGLFPCGYVQCRLADQICMQVWKGTGSLDNSMYGCQPLPADCSTSPSCDCLFAHPDGCLSTCTGTAATGLHAICAPAFD